MIASAIDRDNNYTLMEFRGTLPVRPTTYTSVNLLTLGKIVVPWPDGLTAEEALMVWKQDA